MVDTDHSIEFPITPEDVLRLQEIERGSDMYHQCASEPDNAANNAPIHADGPSRKE